METALRRMTTWIVLALTAAVLSACDPEAPGPEEGADAAASERDAGALFFGDAGQTVASDASTPPADAGFQGPPDAGPAGPDASCAPVNYATPSTGAASALIVTTEALRAEVEPIQWFHTLTGTRTDLVTVEAICTLYGGCQDANPRHDKPWAIKKYLVDHLGYRFVLLAGDQSEVPSRYVHDAYTNPLGAGSFDEDFATHLYFADLSEWDTNSDGVYAGDGDVPFYEADLAVSRLPISAADARQARAYVQKLIYHYTRYDPSLLPKALLVTNVATTFMGIDIDGAWYFEDDGRTLSLLPQGFAVKKLYATGSVDSSASSNSVANQTAAIQQGQNLIVHAGHGSEYDLTVEFTGGNSFDHLLAGSIANAHYPILLSCACLAGNYAYWTMDAAGEKFVTNQNGGGIAYLGNAATGLGLAGGSQFIDEMLRYIGLNPNAPLGEALLYAHANLPTNDDFTVPYLGFDVPVVDPDSWEWTQKSVVLLGDALIPVWTSARPAAPSITATRQALCSGSRITFQVSPPTAGTLRFQAGSAFYELPLSGQGSVTVDLRDAPAPLRVGFSSAATMYGYYEFVF